MPSGPGPVSWIFVGARSLLEAQGSYVGTDIGRGAVLTDGCRNWPGPVPALPGGGGEPALTVTQGLVFVVPALRWSLGPGA